MKDTACTNLVTVVIPVYNAANYIKDTILSVLNQSHSNLELIVVNDGSIDETESVVHSIHDSRINYFYKSNQGVSVARNFGMDKAKGDYIVFLDADDLLSVNFISKRVAVLKEFHFFSFACGYVTRIDHLGNPMQGLLKSACNDIPSEILLFENQVVSCPSSYLFKLDELKRIGVRFNEKLSSSADRYFLLEINERLKGHFIRDVDAVLNYRFSNNSMSNNLTVALIKDNEVFFDFVSKNYYLDKDYKNLFLSKANYVLSGAYFKVGGFFKAFKFALLSFVYHPINFCITLLKLNREEL